MAMDGQPEIGTKAPQFSLMGTGGKKVELKDFIGRKHLVIYFYPKDSTPGCTVEACGFRDEYGQFEELETVVLGVSKDTMESHESFSSKHDLPYLLLSDPDIEVCKAYGVFGTKSVMGREFLGIHRTTFVIDKTGTIRQIYPSIKVREHATEVLQFVKQQLA